MPRATSRQNPRLKETARLVASSRDRRKSGRCVLEGEHLIGVYIDRVGPPEMLLVVEEMKDDPRVARLAASVPPRDVFEVPAVLFAGVSALPAAVGVLAVIPAPTPAVPEPQHFHLLLDDVQDPGNVGTLLRTAAAAGVDQVLLSKQCAFAWSPKALRAAQGAHFLTRVLEAVDLCEWAVAFRSGGGQVAATVSSGGSSLYAAALSWPLAVVIGNEGAGISPGLLAQSDRQVRIPMPGGMESLNAAAAAAVVLFEAVRTRPR
ncbi:MAG: RNA methyltransferase [Burkholderiales bacterium]|nr:RNA methyltransferase [Burkholderiales bacterium]